MAWRSKACSQRIAEEREKCHIGRQHACQAVLDVLGLLISMYVGSSALCNTVQKITGMKKLVDKKQCHFL